MDFAVLRPRTPPKKELGDEFRLKRHRAPRMPTDGCHLAVCSLFVRIFCIEVFLTTRFLKITRAFLYRVGPRILSSTFWRTRSSPMDHQLDHCWDNSSPSMSCLRSSSTKIKIGKVLMCTVEGRFSRRNSGDYKLRELNVSPWRMSPVSNPLRNQRIRCSEAPWVNESGTTYP